MCRFDPNYKKDTMKRGRRKKNVTSPGQIAFDEMRNCLEFYTNKKTGKLFVLLDDDLLVNPVGKTVEFREEYYEELEADYWDLTEEQRVIIRRNY